MELEPSEEFPILYGLLTERRKGAGRPSVRGPMHHFRRAMTTSVHKSAGHVNIAEPDSSTPEVTGSSDSEVTDLPKVDSSIFPEGHASPLLILRLTAPESGNRCYGNVRGGRRVHDRRVIQSNHKVISAEDECTPSSTTPDADEVPVKRHRSATSLPLPSLLSINDELPSLEPMVSTSSPSTAAVSTVRRRSDDSLPPTAPNSAAAAATSSVFYNPEARSYNCNYCDLKFRRQFHLLRHVARHEELKREFCCHCNTSFYRKDNLLVHQSKCQRQGQRSLPSGPIIRTARPPPRTLADLLDRDIDRPLNSSSDSAYIHLPSGLEISEVPSESEESRVLPSENPSPPRPQEQVPIAEEAPLPEAITDNEDSAVEIFPCSHCREVFETFSRLLKHTASKHIKSPSDGTFHFEIETILEQV